MKIGKRYFLILKEIIENSDSITGKELESIFQLSRKQLGYGITKINEYLSSCGYPEITRAANGKINVPAQVISGVNLDELARENEDVRFSIGERMDILHLMLLTSKEELSLQHFISELKVSKNTVLADLKKLDKALQQSRLRLSYGRQDGYTLVGAEYDKRQLLIITLSNMIIQQNNAYIVREICGLKSSEILRTREMLQGVEKELELRFAGEMLEANSYLFTILFQRVKDGLWLEELPESLHMINETVEYGIMKRYANEFGIEPEKEIIYLTAHIQGMKLESFRWVRDAVNDFKLRKIVREIIENYERLAGIKIKDKDELENLLTHHCGPALYRIRYDFHIGLDITEFVLPTYQYLHELVRQAVKPLEQLEGKKIPEKELVYITLIIVSYTAKEGLAVGDYRPKAIVVCQNGITVSRVLLNMLGNLIPEVKFINCMSANQFLTYEEPYDLVFSTISLKSTKNVFVIDPLMNEKQQKNLREKVLKSYEGSLHDVPDSEEILKMAMRYTNENLLNSMQKRDANKEEHLRDLLTLENIKVLNATLDWKDAIEFAAMPLFYKYVIQIRYIEAVIESIEVNRPYLAIADGVVIAHAGIDEGVNDVGISMLVLPEKISIHDYMEANIIIVLATPNYEKHLTALNELILVLEDTEKLKHMKNAKTPEDILGLI